MEGFRSRSYADGRNMQIEVYRHDHPSLPPLRSYSTSSYQSYELEFVGDRVVSCKKKKSRNERSSSMKGWGFGSDPEIQRKRRVAGYKAYEVEGKLKGSFRKSFRWIKNTYNQVLYGYS